MYSWKFRLMEFLHAKLAKLAKTITNVVVVENNAAGPVSYSDLLKFINAAPAASSIVWPGFIKFHPKGYSWYWKDHDVIQGSKVISFRRDALAHTLSLIHI